MAKMRVVIYLRGEDDGELDDAEKRCSEHAERFGWQVLDVTRHKAESAGDLSQLVLKVSKLRAQIIVTDTLDMLSPDAAVRDGFMEAIERQQCIVHPVNMPPSPYDCRIGRRCRRSGDGSAVAGASVDDGVRRGAVAGDAAPAWAVSGTTG